MAAERCAVGESLTFGLIDLYLRTGCPHHVHTMLMLVSQTLPLRCAP